MIEFVLQLKTKSKRVWYYHEWDIHMDDVVLLRTATDDDIGKYGKLNDGSDLYVQILGTTVMTINTSAGAYRKADIIYCAVPKDPDTSPYGIHITNVHPLVRPYTKAEYRHSYMLMRNPRKNTKVTKRVAMLTMEKLKEQTDESVVTPEWFMNKIIAATEPSGKNFAFAMKTIAVVYGINIDKTPELGAGDITQRVTYKTDEGHTISEERKIPTKRTLTKIITKAEILPDGD